jgi:hypothetical protein
VPTDYLRPCKSMQPLLPTGHEWGPMLFFGTPRLGFGTYIAVDQAGLTSRSSR